MSRFIRCLPLLALFSISALAAPVNINLVSSLLTGQPGQTVTFSADLTNTTATTIFLNSDSLNVAAPLIVNDLKFFLNTPVSLGPGATLPPVQIFDIFIPVATPFGLYPGSFDILGGPATFDVIGSAPFAVRVVPEPATGSMLLAGLVAGALYIRRRSRI